MGRIVLFIGSPSEAFTAALCAVRPGCELITAALDPPREMPSTSLSLVSINGCCDLPLAVAECSRIARWQPSVPILFLAPPGENLAKVLGRAGAAATVSGSASADELAESLQRLLGSSSSGILRKAPLLRVSEDVYLDREGRRLWVAGREQSLTAQKFDILCYFLDRPGRAISARELVAARVLQPSQGQRYRGVIMELRERLGGAGRLIHAVPGYGYRFDASEDTHRDRTA
jgi:DNA-binding response OmpR family regulator